MDIKAEISDKTIWIKDIPKAMVLEFLWHWITAVASPSISLVVKNKNGNIKFVAKLNYLTVNEYGRNIIMNVSISFFYFFNNNKINKLKFCIKK